MKKNYLIALFVVAFLSFIVFFTGCNESDKPVAKVNGEPIMKSTLDYRLEKLFGRTVLDNLIMETLIKQEAKKNNITVSDSELEKQMNKMEKKYGGKSNFTKLLKSRNISLKDTKDSIKVNLLLQKLVLKDVPESKIKEFYEKNKKDFNSVEVARILVPTKKIAEQVKKELDSGHDFDAVAKTFSSDFSTKNRGGYLGVFPEAYLPKVYRDALAKLKPGQYSGIIEQKVRNQKLYAIVKLISRKNTFKQLEDLVKERMAAEKVDKYLKKLKANANIEYLDMFTEDKADNKKESKDKK